MKRLAPWLALAAVAAVAASGCSKTSARPGARLNGPSALAVYSGYTTESATALRPYVAVANSLGDELRIFDAITDKAVLAPALILSLSVPTAPRPMHVVAGSLHDATPAADLLLVASGGLLPRDPVAHPGETSTQFQVVATWVPETHVAFTVDLGDAVPGAALESAVVAPVLQDDGAGALVPTPGRAQLLLAMTGRSLVTIPVSRGAGGEVVLGAPVVQDLGFAPVDLAVSPDGRWLYAASEEPIPGPGGTFGVAELDLSGTPGALAVRPLAARAPTQHVMAAMVAPWTGPGSDPILDTFGPPALRVYAALDPRACGADRPIPCGIAAIDPALGTLAPDPAGELPYQLPIPVPGRVSDLVAAPPQAVSDVAGLTRIGPRAGIRWTQAIGAVATSQGRVYLLDLSHFTVANDSAPLSGNSSTRNLTSVSALPDDAAGDPMPLDTPSLGVWTEFNPDKPQELVVALDVFIGGWVRRTPGYTGSDVYTVSYQGRLPGLSDRLALAHAPGPGDIQWVAVQESLNGAAVGGPPWRGVAHLYDPRLAISVGDTVEVKPLDAALCPFGTFELRVTGHLPPSADHPGGALAVEPSTTQPTHLPLTEPAKPDCLNGKGDVAVSMSVRAGALVATSSSLGYIGRPTFVFTAPQNEDPPNFALQYENEDALSCPIMPDDPADWPPPQAAIDACEIDPAACRATCERLVLARRARRVFYTTDQCATADTNCQKFWALQKLTLPMPKGPVIAFTVGTTTPDPEKYPIVGSPIPPRDAFFQVNMAAGYIPTSRQPYSGTSITGAVMPRGLDWHDRSAFTNRAADGLHGFAAFPDNAVVDFNPAQSSTEAVTVR